MHSNPFAAGTGLPHVVPPSDPARDLLRGLPRDAAEAKRAMAERRQAAHWCFQPFDEGEGEASLDHSRFIRTAHIAACLDLVLMPAGSAPVPTTLVRFRDLGLVAEKSCLEATLFFRHGPRSFYSTIYSSTRGSLIGGLHSAGWPSRTPPPSPEAHAHHRLRTDFEVIVDT